MGRTGATVVALALAATLQAQPAFRTTVNLVTVPVAVTPREQAWRVGELGPADFRILEELRSQYTLGYVPKRSPDGKYPTLRVESTNRNIVVRHRAGYLATTPEP